MSIHFVDGANNYLGAFDDGATPPAGSFQVPAPTHGGDQWDGTQWVDKSAERKAAVDAATVGRVDVRGLDRAQFRALFEHENRIRALEGRPSITAGQFRSWVESQL